MTMIDSFLVGYVLGRLGIYEERLKLPKLLGPTLLKSIAPFLDSLLTDVDPEAASTLLKYLTIIEARFQVGQVDGPDAAKLNISVRALHNYCWTTETLLPAPTRTLTVLYKTLQVALDNAYTILADVQDLVPREMISRLPQDFETYGKERTDRWISAAVGVGLGIRNLALPDELVCNMSLRTAFQIAHLCAYRAEPIFPPFAPPPGIGPSLQDCTASPFERSVRLYHRSCFLIGYALARRRFKSEYIDLLNSFNGPEFKSTLILKLKCLEDDLKLFPTDTDDNHGLIACRSMDVYNRVLAWDGCFSSLRVYKPWFGDEPGLANLKKPEDIWDAVRGIVPVDPVAPIHEPRNLASRTIDEMTCLVCTMVGIGLALRGICLKNKTIHRLDLRHAVQIGFFAAQDCTETYTFRPCQQGSNSAVMAKLAGLERAQAVLVSKLEDIQKDIRREKRSREGSLAQGSADEKMSPDIDDASDEETAVAEVDGKDDAWVPVDHGDALLSEFQVVACSDY